jgi:hypothetical protein
LSETTSDEALSPAPPPGAGLGAPNRRQLVAFVVGLLALYAIHLGLLSHFMPTDRMTGEVPISGFGDYSTHINQAALVSEGINKWGQTWVYDPFLIAGYPAGTLFDVDNKAWELFVHFGMKLGWSLQEGFNWYVVLAHLLVPAVMVFAARCFGLGYAATLIATMMGMGLWWFDSFVHWCWWAGMLAFTFAGYLFLVPLACFWKWMQKPSWPWAIASALSLGLLHLVHPFAFFACAVPMLAIFWRKWPELDRVERGTVFGIAGTVLIMNAWWLSNAIEHWEFLVDSSHYGQSSIRFFFADVASLMLQPETTGMLGTRSGFRFLTWTLGLVGLWRWHRAGDPRALMLGSGFIFGFVLTYFGGYLKLTAQIQPYRFVMPIAYMASLPAAVFVVDAIKELREEPTGKLTPYLAACMAFLASMHLIRDVNYFMARLLPTPVRTFDGHDSFYNAEGYPHPVPYHYGQYAPPTSIIDFVKENDDGQSRWMVDVSFLGEELAWQTRAQVIGGFTLRNITHSWGNYFRRKPQGVSRPEELRAYMETFGVGWIIVAREDHFLYRVENPELSLVAMVDRVKIFKPRFKPRLVVGGDPERPPTVEVGVNRIGVRGSDPQAELLLRFHYMDTMRCRPDCTVEHTPADDEDVIGFMKVPAPHPADFEIFNAY